MGGAHWKKISYISSLQKNYVLTQVDIKIWNQNTNDFGWNIIINKNLTRCILILILIFFVCRSHHSSQPTHKIQPKNRFVLYI